MNPKEGTDRDKRRRKMLIINTYLALAGYVVAVLAALGAKLFGFSTMAYTHFFILLVPCVSFSLFFLLLFYSRPGFSSPQARKISFVQFAFWALLFGLYALFLNEARTMGLFFGILALCFLLTSSNFKWSLILTLTVTVFHIGAAYIGRNYLNQASDFKTDLFYAFNFLPAAIFISYLSGRFSEQKNEIKQSGTLAEQSRDALQTIIVEIRKKCETLNSASKSLSNLSELMSGATIDIAGKFNSVTSVSKDMSAKINSVASSMEGASNNVSLIATAVEEMTSTVNEIAQNSEKARDISNRAVDQSKSASSRVDQLGQVAHEIGNITEVISDISAQTNLLALNATIEAARAGDSGRGFAVVANEIKELARQTAEATLQIKEQVSNIQQSTSITIDEIMQFTTTVDDINQIVDSIATAIEEQSISTKEIASNVAQTSSGITEVSENTKYSSDIALEISNTIDEVNHELTGISNNSSQVSLSVSDLDQLAKDLQGLAAKSIQ